MGARRRASVLPLVVAMLLPAAPAAAYQARPQNQARPSQQAASPLPDEQTLLKLLWSTMAAVDQANKTGNYSVLRDLGSAGFQNSNNAATLAQVFTGIREQRVDLSGTLLLMPTYEFAPAITGPGLLRMRGSFNMRPTAAAFDLIYQWDAGWRLHAISILPFAPGNAPARR